MKRCLLFAFLFFLVSDVFAVLRLPGIFSDHMVLQRNSVVSVWGWSQPNETVRVTTSWLKDTVTVQSKENARWELKLSTPEAGGPYELHVMTRYEKLVLKDVLIGEVWLCSGQSNMEWNVYNGLPQMEAELPNATNKNIRLMHVQKKGAEHPQEDLRDTWKVCNPEDAKSFSAVAYFLAKRLQNELNVPIGVINASWGGTPAEVWTPEAVVTESPFLKGFAAQQKYSIHWPVAPGVLWNAMIHPLVGYKIAGACWYQGESNVGTWQGYHLLFSGMIQAWRQAWGYEFPFYFVQIAPYTYNSGNAQSAALLREQQQKTLSLPSTAMVVVTDITDNVKDIHPRLKKEVGDRLAAIALAEMYQRKLIDYKSPVFDYFKIEKNRMRIHFKYLNGALVVKGAEVTDLFLAGADGVFYPAKGVVDKNTLLVTSDKVPNPVAVRFGFTDTSIPNLFNSNGLPVSPFRTDTWELR